LINLIPVINNTLTKRNFCFIRGRFLVKKNNLMEKL
jgi:hypothetical protein